MRIAGHSCTQPPPCAYCFSKQASACWSSRSGWRRRHGLRSSLGSALRCCRINRSRLEVHTVLSSLTVWILETHRTQPKKANKDCQSGRARARFTNSTHLVPNSLWAGPVTTEQVEPYQHQTTLAFELLNTSYSPVKLYSVW